MGKKLYESVEVVINNDGEVLEQKTQILRKVKSQDFIQVYLSDISGLLKIDNGTQLKILTKMWEMAQFDTNQIVLVKAVKQKIADELGLSYKTVDNNVSKLLRKSILLREATSVYYLNPKYFFKGYKENRTKVMQTTLKYQIEYDEEVQSDS